MEKNKNQNIEVVFEDGKKFYSETAADTMAEALKYIGPDKIVKAGLGGGEKGDPTVGRKGDFKNAKVIASLKSIGGGYYVSTHSGTNVKKGFLEKISKGLKLGFTVSIVDGERSQKPEGLRRMFEAWYKKHSSPTKSKDTFLSYLADVCKYLDGGIYRHGKARTPSELRPQKSIYEFTKPSQLKELSYYSSRNFVGDNSSFHAVLGYYVKWLKERAPEDIRIQWKDAKWPNVAFDLLSRPAKDEELKGFDADVMRRLQKSRQIVLCGAPGTGKTYLARRIAAKLTKGSCVNDWMPCVCSCQFHPTFDYSDFIEGLRPVRSMDKSGDGKIGFERKDGIFMKFCRRIVETGDTSEYVFIIDEFNRGDVSKIFGEVFQLIEKDYRGPEWSVKTRYNNLLDQDDVFKDGFYIPKNVSVIATMNDVDRGVESIDFAIRRRFEWVNVEPNDRARVVLRGLATADVNLAIKRMNALNSAISGASENMGPAYVIGPAYFAAIKEMGGGKTRWDNLWKHKLEPLLREYLRGSKNIDSEISALKDKYELKDKK